MPEIPPEVLEQIFARLPRKDLNEICIVSRQWMKVALEVGCADDSYLNITCDNLERIKYALVNVTVAAYRLESFKRMQLTEVSLSDDLKFVLLKIGHNIIELKLINVGPLPLLETFLPNLRAASIWHRNEENTPNIDLSHLPHLSSLQVNAPGLARDLLWKVFSSPTRIRLERLDVRVSPGVTGMLMNVIFLNSATLKHLRIHLDDIYQSEIDWRYAMNRLVALESFELFGHYSSSWLHQIVLNMSGAAPLRRISLYGIADLTQRVSNILQTKWPTLNELNIRCASTITNSSIDKMADLRFHLKDLNLCFCVHITSISLASAVGYRPLINLEKLNLAGCDQLGHKILCLLLRLMPNLLSLNLSHCSKSVTNHTMVHIFHFARKLRELRLNQCHEINAPLARTDTLQDLEVLQLHGVGSLTDDILLKGFRFKKLREITISNCLLITTTGVKSLIDNCPTIENLTLASCIMLTDEAVIYIAEKLGRLRKLDLNNCYHLTSDCLPCLEQASHLQELNLSGISELDNTENRQRVQNLYKSVKERNFRFKHTCC